MKFSTQIANYTGDADTTYQVSAADDTLDGSTSQWFTEGIRDVIARVEKIMPAKLSMFASEASITSTGLELTNDRVFSVERGGKIATEVSAKLRHKLTDIESIYYTYPDTPAYYKISGKLHVVPTPDDTGANTGIISLVKYTANGVDLTAINTSANHNLVTGDFIDITADTSLLPAIYTKNTFKVTYSTVTQFAIEVPWSNINDSDTYNNVDDSYTPDSTIYYSRATATAEVVKVGDIDSANGTIASFPESMYHLPVLYTAANIMYAKLVTIRKSIASTLASTGITNASNYISNWGGSDEFDFKTMMEDEDTEIAQMALSGAQTELGTAQAQLGVLTADYNWVMGQLQYIKGLYNEAFIQVAQS
jgi:hypothetical protein